MGTTMRGIILLILALTSVAAQSPFVHKPYLQLGNSPKNQSQESVAIVWHTPDSDGNWTVEARNGQGRWRMSPASLVRRVNVRATAPHRVYQATVSGLKPGAEFDYRVKLDGKEVFASTGRARSAVGEEHTIGLFGDIAQDTDGQRAVAWQMHKAKPAYTVILGDVVYSRGTVSEYVKKYFPVYNCDEATQDKCAPLLRSTMTVAIPGNHDIGTKVDFGSQPDALAYFYYFSLPMNGPLNSRTGPHLPEITGSTEAIKEFHRTAATYPRGTMFSFDYGDVHWTMLDSNSYVDWTDPKLREWVREDLRAAKKAAWRFVGLHHPPFQSSKNHFGDQWMRLLADIFQEEGVDVVFSGHVHNYQRSYPLTFQVKPEDAAKRPMIRGKIDGTWALDKAYDGVSATVPKGVIWIVSGAGGAGLYNGEQESDRSSWQEFTTKFVATVHSFTLVDVSPKRLTIRQVSKDGNELDRFSLTR